MKSNKYINCRNMPREQKLRGSDEFEMAKALLKDGLSLLKISKQTGIPYATLHDHLRGKYVGQAPTSFGPAGELTKEEENSLINYVEYMAVRGHPMSRQHLKKFVIEIVKRSGRETLFNLENGPSDKWVSNFMKRHSNLTLRKSHPLEKCRAEITQQQLDQYYELLESTLKRLDLANDPPRIFNCDESGFSGRLNTSKKVIVPKFVRHAYQTHVAISGHITLLLAISAAGQTTPPMLIFSGALPRAEYSAGVPDNWLFKKTDSGYINNDLYLQWFNDGFLPSIGKKRPVLLILDNHVSHLSTYAIDAARDNGVDLLFFPSHSSHLLQPLDVVYFHALKQKVADISVDLGYFGVKTLPRHLFPKILMQSMNRLTGATVSSSFLATGIFPFNKTSVTALQKIPSESKKKACDNNDQDRQKCEGCGQSKENILVKMGLVSAELVNILVESPSPIKPTRKNKRKTLDTARVYPSTSSSSEKEQTADTVACINETTNTDVRPSTSSMTVAPKRKRSESVSKTNKRPKRSVQRRPKVTVIDDENILCIVCLTNSPQYYWVGCDNCDKWAHYECLPAHVQTDVDLSLITGHPWLCNVCVQSEE